jgi:type I restriction enzyme, S subunit
MIASGTVWPTVPARRVLQRLDRPVAAKAGTVTAFRDGQVVLREARRVEGFTESFKDMGYQGVRPGDLVVHSMDAFAGAIGVSESEGKMSPVAHIYAGATNTDLRFVSYYLRHLASCGYIQSLAKGIRERSTSFDPASMAEVPIPRPPLHIQQRIADFLDDQVARLNTIIEATERQELLLREEQMVEVGELTRSGPRRRLAHLLSLLRDGTHGSFPRIDDGIPLLSVRNIVDDRFVFRDDDSCVSEDHFREIYRGCPVRNGDVLLAIVGATLGKVAQATTSDRFCLQRSVAVLRPTSELHPRYLVWALRSNAVQDQLWLAAGYSAQPGVYLGTVAGVALSVPDLRKQNDAVELLDRLDDERRSGSNFLSRRAALVHELKRSLIASAVTGDLDVSSTDGSRVPV